MPDQQTIQNNSIVSELTKMALEGEGILNDPLSIIPQVEPEPEAKVLLTIESHCSCGSLQQHSNPFLLIRCGTTYHKPDFWARVYDELPPEVITRMEDVQSCGECFF